MALKLGRVFVLAGVLSGVWGVKAVDRYASPEGGNTPPFITWADAATNIQDAIDAASPGDVVWVTNGVYSTGGKVRAGDLTNRVALDKALTVQSVNGPEVTIIQGAWHPGATNGATAVRCAWLTNGATLGGFTLTSGATRSSGNSTTLLPGGGVWCSSSSSVVSNCWILNNVAATSGGGAFEGTLNECLISGNRAISGGGAFSALTGGLVINNSRITGNSANMGGGVFGSPSTVSIRNSLIAENRAIAGMGGGVSGGTLVNCTVTKNSASSYGGGVANAYVTNCIVQWNSNAGGNTATANYLSSPCQYSCTTPLPGGVGNISDDPQLLGDGFHLAETSPCRGAGTSIASGLDIDGQAWADPPSMGCDEWSQEPVASLLSVSSVVGAHGWVALLSAVAGEPPFGFQWSKDGVPLSESAAVVGAVRRLCGSTWVTRRAPERTGRW